MDTKQLSERRARLKAEGFALLRYDDGPVHSYPYDAPWLDDPAFNEIYDSIRHNTLVDRPRCYALYQLTQQIASVPGDVLEVGTWRGGTGAMLAKMLPGKTIFLADTFKGVVKSQTWEHYEDKAHDDTSEDLVRGFLCDDLKLSNVAFLTGIFPEETGAKLAGRALALVYIDVDVYLSAKDAFEHVWGSLSQFGLVVFDDYGMISACGGIKKFVDEIKDHDDKLFIQNLNGQAYVIKTRI